MDLLDNGGQAGVAFQFIVGIQRVADLLDSEVLDGLEHIVVHLFGLEGELLFADLGLNAGDELGHLAVFLVAGFDGVHHDVLFDLVGASFDHNDLLAGAGNGQVQVRDLALLLGGAEDDFAVHKTGLDAADGAVPRNVGDGQSEGGTQHTGNLRRVILIHRQDGHHDRNVVAHILGEERTDGAVHQTGGQDSLLGGTAFAFQESAGDLAHSVHFLFKIHRQREEVDALAGRFGSGDVDHHRGVAEANQAGAVGQACHLAGLEADGLAGKFGFKDFKILKHGESSVFFPFGSRLTFLARNPGRRAVLRLRFAAKNRFGRRRFFCFFKMWKKGGK